jgi:trk system potassium uptake protein TrkA
VVDVVYVIVVGGGGVGVFVTKMLEEQGYMVTIIEINPERAEDLHHLTHSNIIVGDATNPRVLESAEVKKASYFIAVTGDDKTNLISAMLAKHYGVENIIVRVVNPEFREICNKLGISNIINPAETVAIQIDALIRGIKFIDFIRIASEDIDVEELYIREGNYADQTVRDVKVGSKDIIYPLMIIRKDKILIPYDNVKLQAGDKLMILRKRKKFLI